MEESYLLFVVFGIIVILCYFLSYNKQIVKHEMAHAKKAVNLNYKALVILPFAKRKKEFYRINSDGIEEYYITKERYNTLIYKSAAAICFHNAEKYTEKDKDIIKAGALYSIRYAIRIYLINILIEIVFFIVYKLITGFPLSNDTKYVILGINTLAAIITCYFFYGPKPNRLYKFKRALEEAKKNHTKTNEGLDDGTKIWCYKEFCDIYNSTDPEFYTTYNDIKEALKDIPIKA